MALDQLVQPCYVLPLQIRPQARPRAYLSEITKWPCTAICLYVEQLCVWCNACNFLSCTRWILFITAAQERSPKKLDRMARLIKHKLGNRYGLVLPTATRVRKIGSTTVALNVGGGADATMIHRQLSHTPKTDELHYQAIVDHCKVCVVPWKQGFPCGHNQQCMISLCISVRN